MECVGSLLTKAPTFFEAFSMFFLCFLLKINLKVFRKILFILISNFKFRACTKDDESVFMIFVVTSALYLFEFVFFLSFELAQKKPQKS